MGRKKIWKKRRKKKQIRVMTTMGRKKMILATKFHRFNLHSILRTDQVAHRLETGLFGKLLGVRRQDPTVNLVEIKNFSRCDD